MEVTQVSDAEKVTITRRVELPKFNPEDIASVVGPSMQSCEKNPNLKKLPSLRKEVISKSWRSFKTYDEENGGGRNPGKIFVKLVKGDEEDSDDQKLYADIQCESEEMYKFIMMHLTKYQDSFKKPVRKNFHTIYAHLPHHLIPLMIGRGGSGVKSLRTGAVSSMDESVDPGDLEKCEKSFLKVETFSPRDFVDFQEHVSKSEKSDFVGWGLTEEDPIVKVSVSSMASILAFKNFIECLLDVLSQKIPEMIEKDKGREESRGASRRRDIAECEEALANDW